VRGAWFDPAQGLIPSLLKVIGVITEARGEIEEHLGVGHLVYQCYSPYNQLLENVITYHQRQRQFFLLYSHVYSTHKNSMGASCPPATVVAMQPPPLIQAVPCASSLHPAFFTDRFRRVPTGLVVGSGASPVTQGYVYQESEKRKPKL
jgi:hypothetical protein